MKRFLGILLILLGIVLGIWIRFWVMFIGGAVDIINAIKETPTNAPQIALGLLKIVLSSILGWFVGLTISSTGIRLLKK